MTDWQAQLRDTEDALNRLDAFTYVRDVLETHSVFESLYRHSY